MSDPLIRLALTYIAIYGIAWSIFKIFYDR